MTNKEAINMLSMIKVDKTGEFEPLHTWYGGIDKDMQEAVELAKKALSQPDIEVIRQMRPATPEERQGEKEYIDSISEPVGVNFNDLLKHDEEKWIDECFDKLYNAPTILEAMEEG